MRFKQSYLLIIFIFFFACGGEQTNPTREELFSTYACATCHSLKGEELYGPNLIGIYGKEVLVIREGDSARLIVDRKYLKRALTDPDYEKQKDYQNKTMPLPQISKKEINTLLEYVMALSEE